MKKKKVTITDERKYRAILDKLNNGLYVSDEDLEFVDLITELKVKEIYKRAKK